MQLYTTIGVGDVPPIPASSKKRKLSRVEYLILFELRSGISYLTATDLVNAIERKYSVPRSTIRYNLKKLREKKMVECGDKNRKGIPARLTPLGELILRRWENES